MIACAPWCTHVCLHRGRLVEPFHRKGEETACKVRSAHAMMDETHEQDNSLRLNGCDIIEQADMTLVELDTSTVLPYTQMELITGTVLPYTRSGP